MSQIHNLDATTGPYDHAQRESWLGRHAPYILLLVFLYYCMQIAMGIFGDWFASFGLTELFGMFQLSANAIIVLMVAAFVSVLARALGQLVRGASWATILRDILGQPSWWRTWYPRMLRDPASVWDRLPPSLKVMQTVLWLELLLLPAGVVLAVFVIPTFQAVYSSLGAEFPLVMRVYTFAVTAGGYAFPLIAAAALAHIWRWRARLGLPGMVAFNALFSVSQDFWRHTDARHLLRS